MKYRVYNTFPHEYPTPTSFFRTKKDALEYIKLFSYSKHKKMVLEIKKQNNWYRVNY